MTDKAEFNSWSAGKSYEHYMGRWSRKVAAEFLGWLAPPLGADWIRGRLRQRRADDGNLVPLRSYLSACNRSVGGLRCLRPAVGHGSPRPVQHSGRTGIARWRCNC